MINLLMKNKESEMDYSQSILYQPKLHWITYLVPVTNIAIGSIGIIPLFILRGTFQIFAFLLVILFCRGLLRLGKKLTTKIYVTDGFLSITSGIFNTTTIDISLKRIEGILLLQSGIGKLFNYGTLIISTGSMEQSYTISNPEALREVIKQIK